MPYRTSSPASRARCRDGRRGPRLRQRAVEITPMVDAYFGRDGSPERRVARCSRRRPCGAATSWPGCGWRCSTTDRSTFGGLVVGTGNKTESLIGYTTLFGDSACAFNPIGDLYKSQVRQLAAAIGRARGRSSRKAPERRPVARPDRRGRGLVQLPAARPGPVLADRSPTERRTSWSRWASTARSSSGSTGWSPTSEFKRQVPPIAKLGPRTAGVDYLYPRRRPGSART